MAFQQITLKMIQQEEEQQLTMQEVKDVIWVHHQLIMEMPIGGFAVRLATTLITRGS